MRYLLALGLTTRVKLVLLVAGVAVGIAIPYVTSRFIVGLISLSLILGLFAMSIDLMAGYAGLVTLGHAGVMGSAMYGAGYVAARTGGGLGTQIAVGVLAGMTAAAIFGVMAMRTTGVYFIMITIAQGMIVWGLSIRLNTITGAENGLTGIDRPEVIGAYWQYYYFALATVLAASLLLFIVVRSPMGLALKGLRESEGRMQMLGHNTAFLKFYMFLLSGLFATAAGLLLLYLNRFVSPSDVQLSASAFPVLMAILGGIGTLVGPMIGSFIIVFIQNYVSLAIDRWPTLLGLVFILVVLFAREGIVGAISQGWKRWLHRRATARGIPTEEEEVQAPTQVTVALETTVDQ